MFTDVLTNSSANICITAGDDGVAACATDAAAAVPASPIDAPASICMHIYIYNDDRPLLFLQKQIYV